MQTMKSLLEEHLASSIAKQHALSDLLGDHTWDLDLERGTLDFGIGQVFPVQVLGTESAQNQTWLWAWANTVSDIPQRLLTAAARLRQFGLDEGIAEFSHSRLSSRQADGHALALVASGVCDADCYYRGPYDGGTVYLLLGGTTLRRPTAPERIATVLAEAVAYADVDHRRVATSFLRREGFVLDDRPESLSGSALDGRTVEAIFDRSGRLREVHAASGLPNGRSRR